MREPATCGDTPEHDPTDTEDLYRPIPFAPADSTIWLAKAVNEHGGKVTTLEYSEKHAEVAKRNIAAAGYADCVTVHTGDARMILPNLVEAGEKYDFIFIDADKPGEPAMAESSTQLIDMYRPHVLSAGLCKPKQRIPTTGGTRCS